MTTHAPRPITRPGIRENGSARTMKPLRIITGTEALEPLGGVEICIYEDSTSLVERGHRIELLYTRSGVQRTDFEMLGVSLRGPMRFLFDPAHPVRDLLSFVRSALAIRRLGADILWLNRPETIIWGQVVSRIARIPLVVHLHHSPNYRLEKLLMTGVKEFIAVSQFMKDDWVASGIPADRVTVVHNAVPPEKYPVASEEERSIARRALDIPDGARVAMFFGRVVKSKGVLSVLEAWKQLDLDPKEAILLIVGNGLNADPELQAAFDALPAGTVRHIPGRRDVTTFLHASDLVVGPAWDDEAFGRTHIEAMSAGVPAIGANHSGTAEILSDGMDRLMVPRRDSAALADRIAELLDWREKEPGLGLEVRAHIEKRFPYEAHVDAVSEILQKHSSRRRRGRARRTGTALDLETSTTTR